MLLLFLIIYGVMGIDYSMRSMSNLGDFSQEYFEGSDEGFRQAADYTISLIMPYLPHLLLALTFIYFAVVLFPKRAPKFYKKLPITQKRRQK